MKNDISLVEMILSAASAFLGYSLDRVPVSVMVNVKVKPRFRLYKIQV